ncbi:wax ester synthase/diacylglycerol acyltransferase 2-like [Cryptomeria japonica]|uniref:wax ester synthase/diacylglycerol acyltransferase 2-like n=1 Tax=Cryptomeria japonica TaxID=3369 RepID=UPI0027DA2041|nr:wax ester synthase/diacylglycerol acyltransferase 2-like [Cryptomeria japonica]
MVDTATNVPEEFVFVSTEVAFPDEIKIQLEEYVGRIEMLEETMNEKGLFSLLEVLQHRIDMLKGQIKDVHIFHISLKEAGDMVVENTKTLLHLGNDIDIPGFNEVLDALYKAEVDFFKFVADAQAVTDTRWNEAIFELEEPIDICTTKQAIKNLLLPRNPRFCCKMTENRHGVLHWVETEVNVDDHVIVPEFPPGHTEYDEFVKDYISNIHLTPLPKCKPLWAFHFLNYSTSKARATLVINMHHSLGDGTSLMSLLLCCVTRADNPNLPVTFPSFKSPSHKTIPYYSWVSTEFMYYMFQRLFMPVLVLWYTVSDLISSFLRIVLMEDSKLHFRGPPGVEMLPKTVNDVVMGVIFCGFQRYLETTLSQGERETSGVRKEMARSRVTGILFMNTRALSGLNDIKYMLKLNSRAPWGNRIGMLQIPMPVANAESPLDFVRRAKQIIDRKKMSLEVFLTRRLLSYLGRRASARGMYNTLANTTLALSNMIGPTDKIAINQIPVKSISFSVSGIPQTLLLTVVSYMGSVRLEVIGTKGYVNSATLAKCFTECFEEMKEATKGS